MRIRHAESDEDLEACRSMIARVYRELYDVALTDGVTDPDGGVERFPDRFALGEVDGRVIACCALYTSDTYIERYGGLDAGRIEAVLAEAGVPLHDEQGRRRPFVEYTKVVVDPAFARQGFGRQFLAATHARAFLAGDDGVVPFLLVCARLSVFRLWDVMGLRTRWLGPFPLYRNHARYRSEHDPMESRVLVPELDVAPRWFLRPWPTTVWSPPASRAAADDGTEIDLRVLPNDLNRHWKRCFLTAEYLTGVLAPRNPNLVLVIDELLENAAKFSSDLHDPVTLTVRERHGELVVRTRNRTDAAHAADLRALVERLRSADLETLFVEQLERNADGDASRLGFLTMCLHADARLHVEVEPGPDQTCEVTVEVCLATEQKVAA